MNLSSLKKSSKIFALVFLVMIILVATIFLGKGAQSLFSKAATCDVAKVSSAQVTANSSVITWESKDVRQGTVEYGINTSNLNFTAPEGTESKTHNVPLSLLTANTVYYYWITYGVPGALPGTSKKLVCDPSGSMCEVDPGKSIDQQSDSVKKCVTNLVPWSFTTAAVTPQAQIVAPIPTATPTRSATPTVSTSSASLATSSATASSSASLSVFCQQVKLNIGQSNAATNWATLKQYDVDGNGIINGMDAIKCTKSGK